MEADVLEYKTIILSSLLKSHWDEVEREHEAILQFEGSDYILRIEYNSDVWQDAITFSIAKSEEPELTFEIFFKDKEELKGVLAKIVSFQNSIPDSYDAFILSELSDFKVNTVS